MFLFIFESIGTSELIMIGIVALIFLGPRRLPEMAKKAGKIMAEFRGTANEFKETWEREVNFEEEAKSLNLNSLEAEAEAETIPRATSINPPENGDAPDAPAIKEIDASAFDQTALEEKREEITKEEVSAEESAPVPDKVNWL